MTGERRGVGGIFFDDLDDNDQDKIFKFSTVSQFLQFGGYYFSCLSVHCKNSECGYI